MELFTQIIVAIPTMVLWAVWYGAIALFWVIVFILFGFYALVRGFYNAATQRSFSDGVHAPRTKFPHRRTA
ncbi:hypothetical protein [Streptomyces sp. bgisy130]|uniref:hypothetical protein n=1 Tax=Streptomyces sp. bgisy130 TaxID=3413788 RepID=UPI003F4A6B2E